MTVKERIKEARKAAGFTQKKLAEGANLAEITIRQYEKGSRNPTMEAISKIAIALDADANYLMYGQSAEEHEKEWIARKHKSADETVATTHLYEAYGYKYETVEVEGELPYRSDWIVTAPDGTKTRFTYKGRLAYGEKLTKELKRYAIYLHDEIVKEFEAHDDEVTKKDK